jgi:hypothetical protein
MNIKHKDVPHTSPQNYRDLDGNMRTFTMVDHDPKTKINVPLDDGTNPTEELKKYRSRTIEKILSISASYCPTIFMDYTLRGENVGGIVQWNKVMLEDPGTPTDRLTQLYTLVSNTQDLVANRLF